MPQGPDDVRGADLQLHDFVEGVALEEDQLAGAFALAHRSSRHDHAVVWKRRRKELRPHGYKCKCAVKFKIG